MKCSTERYGLVTLVVLVVVLVLMVKLGECGGNRRVVSKAKFPITLANTTKTAFYCPSARPSVSTYVYLDKNTTLTVLSALIGSIVEVDAPYSVLAGAPFADSFFVTKQYDFDENTFEAELIEESDSITLHYTTILDNDAVIDISFIVNNASEEKVPIPRLHKYDNGSLVDNSDCHVERNNNRTCNCSADHILPQNSVKITISISDWPWQYPDDKYGPGNIGLYRKMLGVTMPITGVFTGDTFTVDVCGVSGYGFEPKNGIRIPFSFFNYATYEEAEIKPIYLYSYRNFTTIGNEVTLPFGFFFTQFNQSVTYDPDFSVLFGDSLTVTSKGGNSDSGVVSVTTTTTGTSHHITTTQNNSGLSGGAKAGIVIGVLAAACIAIAPPFCHRFHRCQNRSQIKEGPQSCSSNLIPTEFIINC